MNHNISSRQKRRKYYDRLRILMTYIASSISIIVLGAIILYVFLNGIGLLNIQLITGHNKNITTTLKISEEIEQHTYDIPNDDPKNKVYGSKRYGVLFKEDTNYEGHPIIVITHLHELSPLKKAVTLDKEVLTPLKVGDAFYGAGLLLWDDQGNQIRVRINEGAEKFAASFDQARYIDSIPVTILATGIRGSIITTLYLIGITLIIALPIGVSSALYLHEIAKQNKITQLLRTLIDMLTGIPSIIYGLMGAAVFIPLTRKLFGENQITGGSLLSGALTLAVIVLPVIIKATESALDVVPKDYKLASLALGANKTQTTFKVMLPNAIPGILSAALLSIGRIMGESAALIYAIGTVVRDQPSLKTNGTSLAVHIWSSMAGDSPNFALASAISIIILMIVLSLNIIVKMITKRFVKRFQ